MTSSSQLTVIFDGTCGFCTHTVRLLRTNDRQSRITWIPCQQLNHDDSIRKLCADAVVAITEEGAIDTGAQAFFHIIGTMSGSPWPVRIASLPVISSLLSLGYRVIARVRSHLPGDIPWCDQHPDDCQPPSP